MAGTETILDFDAATSLNLTDVMYILQGVGADRDKHVDLTLLKEFLNTDITLTGTLIHGTSYTVTTQTGFNDLIERVSANAYKFKDAITSVHLRHLTGGYLCYGGTSFLSDGDTWGRLNINNVENFTADYGTYLAVGDTNFYLYIDYSNKYFKNIWLKGIGSTAVVVNSDFDQQASVVNITYDNCMVSDRTYDTITHSCFYGRSDDTTKHINCTVKDVSTTTTVLYAFLNCRNANHCVVDNISSTTGNINGFASGKLYNNCMVLNMSSTGGNVYGFVNSDNITNCMVDTIETTGTGILRGFLTCNQISNGIAQNLTGENVIVAGFYSVKQVTSCVVDNLTATGTGAAQGFSGGTNLSSCTVINSSTNSGNMSGFSTCHQLAACSTDTLSSTSGSVIPFSNCDHGAALDADVISSTGNDYMDTADTNITNKNSIGAIFT